MNSKKTTVCINGQLTSPNDLSTFERGWRYGDGLFETFRTYSGKYALLSCHIERLRRSCEALQFEFPEELNSEFDRQCEALKEACGIRGDAVFRLQLTRASGGKYLPTSNATEWLLQAFGYIETSSSRSLCVYAENRLAGNPLDTHKHSSRLLNIAAAQYAAGNGYDDALLLNERNEVIEATSSAFFIYQNGTFISPNSSGGLQSISQCRLTMKLLENEDQFNLKIRPISLTDLAISDEIILTNVVSGPVHVSSIGKKEMEATASLEILRALWSQVVASAH